MTAYLANKMRLALKQVRILEMQQELKRELTESLLGNWLTNAEPPLAQSRFKWRVAGVAAAAARYATPTVCVANAQLTHTSYRHSAAGH